MLLLLHRVALLRPSGIHQNEAENGASKGLKSNEIRISTRKELEDFQC